jgi:hypothetical protein
LEKLLFLFHELDEACQGIFDDEIDLLRQSNDFNQAMTVRFKTELSAVNQFMIHHFRARWGIDADLYRQSIDNQQAYLSKILDAAGIDPRDRLRRNRHNRPEKSIIDR